MEEKYVELQQSCRVLEEELKTLYDKKNMSDKTKVSSIQNLLPAKVPEVTIHLWPNWWRRSARQVVIHQPHAPDRERAPQGSWWVRNHQGCNKGHQPWSETERHARNKGWIVPTSAKNNLKGTLQGRWSDLYQKILNLSQEPEESAQDFLFRAIELKDRPVCLQGERVRGTLQCRPG